MREIILIRHGRSAHEQTGRIDRDGFRRWREAYEAAGIHDEPPAALRALIGNAALVSSDAPRAIESARKFGGDVIVSPLLRELTLEPPQLRGRHSLAVWAIAYGVRYLRHRAHHTPAELQRAREAAAWLTQLTAEHERIAAFTHHVFRGLVARELRALGWTSQDRGSRHWSAWSFRRIDEGPPAAGAIGPGPNWLA
ncbi:MAG TPA: hypothetical protein VFN10_13450 [Thermoanaerobaculia bacterium]|nr:hypothetical protein [Thermoanaerobaculia bacterium]